MNTIIVGGIIAALVVVSFLMLAVFPAKNQDSPPPFEIPTTHDELAAWMDELGYCPGCQHRHRNMYMGWTHTGHFRCGVCCVVDVKQFERMSYQ